MGQSTKVIAAAAGLAGAAGLAVFVAAPNVASASTGTVSYKAGATTVWKTPSFSQAKRYVSYNQKVTIVGQKSVNGSVWYQVGANEWIPAVYLTVGSTNKTVDQAPVGTKTPAQAAVKTPAKTAVKAPAASTSSANLQLKVTYGEGSVTVWKSTAYAGATGQYLTSGKSYAAVAKTSVNGETWYRLANGGYVPARFVAPASSAALPSTNAAAKTPAKTTVQAPKAPAQASTGKTVVQAASRTAQVQAVINLAKQQIGKPYVWGGKGPASYDCSGLMHYVFLNAVGKEIGGWTVPQESAGTKIAVSQLQPGDLVFWGNAGSTYHVGLYLGGGQYLNAPRPGQNVQIDQFSAYFEPSFGVRVL